MKPKRLSLPLLLALWALAFSPAMRAADMSSEALIDQLLADQKGAPDVAAKRQVLQKELAQQDALIREAQKQGLTQNPSFVVRQEILRRNLIVESYWRVFFEKHPVDPKALNLSYEQLKAANGNRQYHMHQLVAASEAEARQALEALARKESFEAVAAKYSQDRGTQPPGGDLGWLWKFSLTPVAADALVRLKPGEVTAPAIATPGGFLILKLDEVREQAFPGFEQLKTQIERTLQQQAQQDEFKRLQAAK